MFLKKYKKQLLCGFIIIFVISAVSYLFFDQKFDQDSQIVYAGTGDKIKGFAWSENYGWISFNSIDCDADGNGVFNGTPSGCPAAGTAYFDYGVTINTNTGVLSGYAWSSNVGWIYFGPGTGVTISNSAITDPKIWATYSYATGKVTGWANIVSLGDDGWLKMSDDTNPNWNGKGVTINASNGYFSGWAWNKSTSGAGIGWVSFNGADTGAGGDYRVIGDINRPPVVDANSMKSPNYYYSESGNISVLDDGTLKWKYYDPENGAGSRYDVIVKDETSNTVIYSKTCNATSSGALYCNLGCLQNGSECSLLFSVINANLINASNKITYNHKYSWSVQVWDNNNVSSAVTAYNSSPDTSDMSDKTASDATFTVYLHEMPDSAFTVFPTSASIDQEVKLTSISKYYTSAEPSEAKDCTNSTCSYEWIFNATDAQLARPSTIYNKTASSTYIKFLKSGNIRVTLKVTDANGYTNSVYIDTTIKSKLPTIKETK